MGIRQVTSTRFITGLLFVALAGMSAACGGDGQAAGSAKGKDLPVVRLQVLSGGMSALGLKAMEVSNSDEANGFRGEFHYVDGDAENQAFIQGQADVDVGLDPVATAIFRNQGFNVSTYYQYQPNYACLVSKSSYNSPEDLVGKKVGNTGADSGTTQSIAVTLQRFWGISLTKDYVPVEAAPQALVELLKSGEIEAAGLYEPYTSRAVVEGGAKCLTGDVGDVWKKKTGETVSYTSLVAFNKWIDAHPQLALDVANALADGIEWLKEDPTRIESGDFPSMVGSDDQEIFKRLESRIQDGSLYDVRWNDKIVEANKQMLNALAEQGTILKKVPDGVFRTVS